MTQSVGVPATTFGLYLGGKAHTREEWLNIESLRTGLPGGTRTAESLEWLLTTGNEKDTAEEKYFRMEGIAAEVISLLQEQELTRADCGDLEKHAYSVNDGIRDSQTRNLSIFWCVG